MNERTATGCVEESPASRVDQGDYTAHYLCSVGDVDVYSDGDFYKGATRVANYEDLEDDQLGLDDKLAWGILQATGFYMRYWSHQDDGGPDRWIGDNGCALVHDPDRDCYRVEFPGDHGRCSGSFKTLGAALLMADRGWAGLLRSLNTEAGGNLAVVGGETEARGDASVAL